MRIEQLEYLIAIIRHGSLRKAGDQLHLSQPALSESMSNLERELGVTLLDRRRTGARVSSEGRALLPSIIEVIEAVDRLRTAADDREPPMRRVRVGTAGAGAPSLLARAVRDLREERARDAVEVVSLRHADLLTGLVEGSLDLGLVDALPGDDTSSDVDAVELRRGRLVVACHPDHPLADQDSVRLDDLRAEPFVAISAGHLGQGPTDRILGGAPPRVVASADSAGMATTLVAEGLGVTLLPDYGITGDPYVLVGAVVQRPVSDDTASVSLLCLHRAGHPPLAATRLLRDLLVRDEPTALPPAR